MVTAVSESIEQTSVFASMMDCEGDDCYDFLKYLFNGLTNLHSWSF